MIAISWKKLSLDGTNPDLNRIKILWSIVKIKSYEGSKQYNSKADL